MFKNYLSIAFRNLKKNRSYVIINILGLGISMACCIAAYLVLAYNIEFDSYYSRQEMSNVFKVHTYFGEPGGINRIQALAPLPLGPAAFEEIAGVNSFTRFVVGGGAISYDGKVFNEEIDFADSTFFDFFKLPLISGSHSSFKEKSTIFLSEEIAKKYFGDEEPVGKTISVDFGGNHQVDVTIGGVLKKLPANNTFTIETLIRIEHWMGGKIKSDDWAEWREPSTFLRLQSPDNAELVSTQMNRYIPHRNALATYIVVHAFKLEPFLSPFDDDTIYGSYINLRLSIVSVLIVVLLAGMMLLIACFNLTNTSIAMTARRLKEIGVRKSVGAAAHQIALQFMIETILLIFLSMIAGLILAQFVVPLFTDIWYLPYTLEDLNGTNLVIALLGLVFMASVLAGMYPALFSSKFKATLLLKGTARIKGTNAITRSLVGVQFALSVVMLIGGVVFTQNATFQENISFGYDKDKIITVALQGGDDFEIMATALASNPKILSIGVSAGNLGQNSYHSPIQLDTGIYDVRVLGVGNNFFETMGLHLVKGRTFDLENASDSESVVVNTAFLKKTGVTDVLDRIMILHGGRVRIVGVVENHVDDLFRSRDFEPFVFYPTIKEQFISLLIKTAKQDLAATDKAVEQTWKQVFPMKPYESQFQDDVVLKDSRERNGSMKKVFLFITILGSILSASGIFALASLNISRRTKEIGIRKVLGASSGHIVSILNREFVITLSISVILGSVGGYYFTSMILARIYAYHIAVGVVVTILCALAIFMIGILTTSSSILKAASANPVNSLRSE